MSKALQEGNVWFAVGLLCGAVGSFLERFAGSGRRQRSAWGVRRAGRGGLCRGHLAVCAAE
ncbi:MAG: hypothetical protein FJZ90_09770 [Chloroflexi bacterium]|nr:hypothetical protein [Chloroflexota bacterium]